MSSKDYSYKIRKYLAERDAAEDILTSIAEDIASTEVVQDYTQREKALEDISKYYEFIDLIYVLDEEGNLIDDGHDPDDSMSRYVISKRSEKNAKIKDRLTKLINPGRKNRPYFTKIKGAKTNFVKVTAPYASTGTGEPCVSASVKIPVNENGGYRILVVDADVEGIVEYFSGENQRRKLDKFSDYTYRFILFFLFVIMSVLLAGGIRELLTSVAHGFFPNIEAFHFEPIPYLNTIVVFTVALAVFDLVKTLYEEETLLYKDINKPSPARRTVIRFMTTILIALSIETLVQVFKAAHMTQASGMLLQPESMIYGVTALIIGLAVYILLTGYTDMTMEQVREKIATSTQEKQDEN